MLGTRPNEFQKIPRKLKNNLIIFVAYVSDDSNKIRKKIVEKPMLEKFNVGNMSIEKCWNLRKKKVKNFLC